MTKQENYDYAIDCYSLSISYAPSVNDTLLGMLYSNRAHAYFKKKQFVKSKCDAENCLKYRPHWSKVILRYRFVQSCHLVCILYILCREQNVFYKICIITIA